ncbi:MAG: fasciclin domain-containing protein [Caulobacteraceae bacterium]
MSKLLAVAALAVALPTLAVPALARAQAPEFANQAAEPAAAAPEPAASPARIAPSGDIIATLTASGQFTTLIKALDATNLTAVLKTPGPLTLFAPTDAAFAAMPAGQLDQLLNAKPPAALQQLLVYHIVNARVDDAKINGTKGPVPSAAGKPIYVDGSAAPHKANDAVITQDVTVTNGVIHVIDKVLSPDFTPPPAQ